MQKLVRNSQSESTFLLLSPSAHMSSWHSWKGLFIATSKMAGEGLRTPEPAVTEKQIA